MHAQVAALSPWAPAHDPDGGMHRPRSVGLAPAWVRASRLVRIASEADVYIARWQARALAASMGFDRFAQTEIETAVSELAGNVLGHGGGGRVWLRRCGTTVEVVGVDRGPGFRGTVGRPPRGLGIGLAGVGRLMGSVEQGDRPGGGAWVRARRSLPGHDGVDEGDGPRLDGYAAGAGAAYGGASGRVATGDRSHPNFTVAVCSRSVHGETGCGDAYAVVEEGEGAEGGLLVAVADGLGHGEGAEEAARTVCECVVALAGESAAPVPLPELLEHAHRAAAGTRGAVMSLVRFGADGHLSLAGIGNVRVWDMAAGRQAMGTPGCLGVSWQRPAEEDWAPADRASRIGGPGTVLGSDPGAAREGGAGAASGVGPGAVVVTSDGIAEDIVQAEVERRQTDTPGQWRRVVERMVRRSDTRDDALALAVVPAATPYRRT